MSYLASVFGAHAHKQAGPAGQPAGHESSRRPQGAGARVVCRARGLIRFLGADVQVLVAREDAAKMISDSTGSATAPD